MDARRMTQSAIKEGISKGNYQLTGILKTGEVVLAVVSDFEKEILDRIIDLPKEVALEKVNSLKAMTNNQGEELDKAYEQLISKLSKGLVIRF